MGAVIPAMISKFVPSKVISSGTALTTKSHYKHNSTGMRTVCNKVRVFKSSVSMNRLPLAVANKRTISTRVGGIRKIIGDGVLAVFK